MEKKFDLEEMKQQWSTLQTALDSQKEVNIKFVLADAKRRVSWNKGFLRVLSFASLLFTLPVLLAVMFYYGVPQPICIAFSAWIVVVACYSFYMSSLVKEPNDSNLDIMQYGKSLVKFKRFYFVSEAVSTVVIVSILVWMIMSMGFDITHPMVACLVVGGVAGAVVGVMLVIKMLNNVKELQRDLDMIEDLR